MVCEVLDINTSFEILKKYLLFGVKKHKQKKKKTMKEITTEFGGGAMT
jgi:hypothetical protein